MYALSYLSSILRTASRHLRRSRVKYYVTTPPSRPAPRNPGVINNFRDTGMKPYFRYNPGNSGMVHRYSYRFTAVFATYDSHILPGRDNCTRLGSSRRPSSRDRRRENLAGGRVRAKSHHPSQIYTCSTVEAGSIMSWGKCRRGRLSYNPVYICDSDSKL